jgi:hypothetical protein
MAWHGMAWHPQARASVTCCSWCNMRAVLQERAGAVGARGQAGAWPWSDVGNHVTRRRRVGSPRRNGNHSVTACGSLANAYQPMSIGRRDGHTLSPHGCLAWRRSEQRAASLATRPSLQLPTTQVGMQAQIECCTLDARMLACNTRLRVRIRLWLSLQTRFTFTYKQGTIEQQEAETMCR